MDLLVLSMPTNAPLLYRMEALFFPFFFLKKQDGSTVTASTRPNINPHLLPALLHSSSLDNRKWMGDSRNGRVGIIHPSIPKAHRPYARGAVRFHPTISLYFHRCSACATPTERHGTPDLQATGRAPHALAFKLPMMEKEKTCGSGWKLHLAALLAPSVRAFVVVVYRPALRFFLFRPTAPHLVGVRVDSHCQSAAPQTTWPPGVV
jgi:hypothetical protein